MKENQAQDTSCFVSEVLLLVMEIGFWTKSLLVPAPLNPLGYVILFPDDKDEYYQWMPKWKDENSINTVREADENLIGDGSSVQAVALNWRVQRRRSLRAQREEEVYSEEEGRNEERRHKLQKWKERRLEGVAQAAYYLYHIINKWLEFSTTLKDRCLLPQFSFDTYCKLEKKWLSFLCLNCNRLNATVDMSWT